jgi:multiple sugar transport system ATP-binding protein
LAGVTLHGIEKRYGDVAALDDVSLAIEPGEFVSLVGPSGCGKTTLMRVIAGLERADAGRVKIRDRDVTALRGADRDVAMVFQSYALYPHLTVRQNIALPLVMRRLTARQRMPFVGCYQPGAAARIAEIGRDVEAAAGSLGLAGLLERKPSQLSGGQRQRVALGRAIVRRPAVFLMDEPLSNLDAALRVQTRKEIVDLHRRVGASTVYVTHDQTEALTMSDRVAVMMAGRILQVATPEAIYDDPRDLQVARFMGSPRINTLAAEIAPGGAVTIGGFGLGLSTAARGSATFGLRPEHVRLGARAGLEAAVEHIEFLGEAILAHLRLVATGEALIARLAPEERALVPGIGTVRIEPTRGKGFLFDAEGRRIDARALSDAPALLIGAQGHG